MKYIHMALHITQFNNSLLKPRCYFYHTINDAGDMACEYITLDKAHQLMWELVKAGGTREYHANEFNPGISYASVVYSALY